MIKAGDHRENLASHKASIGAQSIALCAERCSALRFKVPMRTPKNGAIISVSLAAKIFLFPLINSTFILAWLTVVPLNAAETPAPSLSGPAESNSRVIKAGVPSSDSRDTIVFQNGDVLYGSLQLIDPAVGIRWSHADATEIIEFVPEGISEVRFGYRTQTQPNYTNACQIRLSNQDEIEGDLLSCDSEKILLDTSYAGKIEMPRKFVQSIAPKPAQRPPVFDGPSGLEGWTMGQVQAAIPNSGQWTYRNRAFYATQSASIARDLKLPDVASIQCDLNWKGMLYIAIALYTDYMQPINLQTKETGPEFGGFYSLQLNSYTVNLLPVTRTDPLRYLGQTSVPAFNQKTKAHLEIRVSKPKRSIALLVDGLLIKQWIDADEFVGKGTGVRFVHQGQGSVKLSNIRVTEWDGQFEDKPATVPDSKNDGARLQNGDRVAGTLQRIQDGKVTFALPDGASLDIPLNRVKLLEMAGQKMERPRDDNANVRATFRRGGNISFRLEKWDNQEVVGTSPNFGKIVVNPAAFDRVQFYPIARPKTTARIAEPFQNGRAVVFRGDGVIMPRGGVVFQRGGVPIQRVFRLENGRAIIQAIPSGTDWR